MLLSDFFEYMVSGELSQVHIGDINTLSIAVEDFPRVIPNVNLGLTELHKRFPLRIEELTIRQQAEISTYTLHNRHAMANKASDNKYKYIHDSEYEPFTNNLLRVEMVYDELGNEIPLNEDIDYNQAEQYRDTRYQPRFGSTVDYTFQSVRTPTFNTLQVLPHPIPENNLLVKYRAAPEKIITTCDLVPGEVEINLPLSLLEPMLLYVGGRIHANMKGIDPNAGAGFYAKFEASCKKVHDLNLYNKEEVINTKLDRAGWV